MEQPLISVIIPIYKVEKYLERCIVSVVDQTYKNLEIILVDDGSPDSCPQMCDEWAERDKRIKVVHKENGGLSDARNAGLVIAKGELVCFVDSDDWIESDMLNSMKKQMDIDDSDIVSCGVNWIDKDNCIIRQETVLGTEILNAHDAMSELLHDKKLKQYVWNKLYKTEIVKNVLFEKGKCHEDVFWTYQVIGIINKISLISQCHYNYFQRNDSIMGEEYSEKRLDALDAMKLRCVYIKDHFPDLFDDALYFYIGSCFFHLQTALRVCSDESIVNNIISRIDSRKTGNPTKNLSIKRKLWFYMFAFFPKTTCKFRNYIKIGI